MILMKKVDTHLSPRLLKTYYKMIFKDLFNRSMKHNRKATKQLLNAFTLEEIYNSVESIYLRNRNLYAPDKGHNGLVLRYCEFGGQDVDALHLLSDTARELEKRL